MAGGDREALGEFFGAWFERIVGLARVMSQRDEAFCLDVAQEVMLRAARSMKPLPDEAALAIWVAQATRSAAVDLLRASVRRAGRERRAAGVEAAPAREDDGELIAWVRREFDAVPEEERVLLVARITSGATLDQAGAALGISGDTAHGRVRRSLDRLRRAAQEWMA
jgi:RNA polymerase sigma-70 factor (ECF subfamily)